MRTLRQLLPSVVDGNISHLTSIYKTRLNLKCKHPHILKATINKAPWKSHIKYIKEKKNPKTSKQKQKRNVSEILCFYHLFHLIYEEGFLAMPSTTLIIFTTRICAAVMPPTLNHGPGYYAKPL